MTPAHIFTLPPVSILLRPLSARSQRLSIPPVIILAFLCTFLFAFIQHSSLRTSADCWTRNSYRGVFSRVRCRDRSLAIHSLGSTFFIFAICSRPAALGRLVRIGFLLGMGSNDSVVCTSHSCFVAGSKGVGVHSATIPPLLSLDCSSLLHSSLFPLLPPPLSLRIPIRSN